MQIPIPFTRDLVLIGGGHAHALVLRMWGMTPLPGTRLTLINPGPTAPYSGMLPGHIAGHYTREALDIDLVKLARFAGARLILGEASAIDPDAGIVTVGARQIAYDLASIDVGIHAELPDIEGFSMFGTGAKPLDAYATRWQGFLTRAKAREIPPEVAVIGGGVAGAELSLAMAHALRRDVADMARVTVIEAGERITGKTAGATRHLKAAMARHGVAVELNAEVTRLTAEGVELADGRTVPARFTVGAAGAFAHRWLADSPLPLTGDGFVKVDAYLRVEGRRDLFAVGDCAYLSHAPRPKAGVYAVRAGPVLFHNLRAALLGDPAKSYRPQGDYLKLVSLGGQEAIAEKYGLSFAAPWVWRWKDRIDRKFMRMFQDLPKMPTAPLPSLVTQGVREELGGRPLCGGCGSKLGPEALSGVLATLPAPSRSDVLSGPGDDAGVLDLGQTRQVLTTDHLRAFTEDPARMARIATVHALGDIWAMGAQPQSAMVQVTLPRMSAPLQSRSLGEIMQAAGEVIRAAGAEVVGGHSTMGAELTVGLSLTGLVDEPITKGGARPGDALILTRPVGAGTVLAAEMQGAARGHDVAHLLATLARPQGDAAEVLAEAHAMTDVTGFGLAGHLMEICRASGVGAELTLDAIPLYPGALALAEAGYRSTLYPANRDAAPVAGAECARGALLHDPQTAGGLLAAVAPARAEALVAALRQLGHEASAIGKVVDGTPKIFCAK
ncbi:selenide, water dikinase SelD [Aliiroseovarius sp.]|uniref:selenide, water dikinase SelD n=1 Tax=Aliiroseovarius sp. TaxID=1872442 RepID=UPI00263839C8|nr:selenide, water dikinase SelD [Aliiroseovarius sp.]